MVQTVLNQARSYLGVRQGDARHKDLVVKYNQVKPLPVGYPMKVSDDWCAAFVTVIGDLSGASSLIGRECGVQRFIGLFKQKGIWLGVVKPRAGDVIVFDWQKKRLGRPHRLCRIRQRESGNDNRRKYLKSSRPADICL